MVRSVDPRRAEEFGPELSEISTVEVGDVVARSRVAGDLIGRLGPVVVADGLRRAADALDAESATLAELADDEVALGVPRLLGEIARTTGQLRLFAGLVARGEHLGVTTSDLPAGAPGGSLRKVNIPLGVVVVFAASNFPFAFSVAGGDTASALAAGNPVIVKAHYGHPQTSQRVAELVTEALVAAGLPADSLQVVHGGERVGLELVRHPDVAAVGFTGSTAGGRALTDVAASRKIPIPVYAEQGSVNPMVIAPSAITACAPGEARQLAESVLSGHGQFCTKPGVVFVPDDAADEFVALLRGEMAQAVDMHLLTTKIHEQFRKAVAALGRHPDVEVWAGETSGAGLSAPGVVAVADVDTYLAVPDLRAEIFGPATVVIRVRDSADLVRALDAVEGNLTATVHGDAGDRWLALAIERLVRRVGRIVYGGVPTGVAVDRAMHHGGPYPASSWSLYTSVGDDAIKRFMRPIVYQDFPDTLLPEALRA